MTLKVVVQGSERDGARSGGGLFQPEQWSALPHWIGVLNHRPYVENLYQWDPASPDDWLLYLQCGCEECAKTQAYLTNHAYEGTDEHSYARVLTRTEAVRWFERHGLDLPRALTGGSERSESTPPLDSAGNDEPRETASGTAGLPRELHELWAALRGVQGTTGHLLRELAAARQQLGVAPDHPPALSLEDPDPPLLSSRCPTQARRIKQWFPMWWQASESALTELPQAIPWMDRADLPPGERWTTRLRQALQDLITPFAFVAAPELGGIEDIGHLEIVFQQAMRSDWPDGFPPDWKDIVAQIEEASKQLFAVRDEGAGTQDIRLLQLALVDLYLTGTRLSADEHAIDLARGQRRDADLSIAIERQRDDRVRLESAFTAFDQAIAQPGIGERISAAADGDAAKLEYRLRRAVQRLRALIGHNGGHFPSATEGEQCMQALHDLHEIERDLAPLVKTTSSEPTADRSRQDLGNQGDPDRTIHVQESARRIQQGDLRCEFKASSEWDAIRRLTRRPGTIVEEGSETIKRVRRKLRDAGMPQMAKAIVSKGEGGYMMTPEELGAPLRFHRADLA